MRVLLDTHILIWAAGPPRRLPKDIHVVLQEQQNEIFFSAASIWKIAIKTQIGGVHFSVQPIEITRAAIDTGFTQLPVFADVAAKEKLGTGQMTGPRSDSRLRFSIFHLSP